MDERKIFEVAKSLEKIPYSPNGRTRNGCDCVGIVLLFYELIGQKIKYEDKDFSYEEKRYLSQNRDYLIEIATKYFNLYFVKDKKLFIPKPGDLIIFRHFRRDVSTHLGIYLTPHTFLHMDETKYSKITKFFYNPYIDIKDTNNWSKRLIGFGRKKQQSVIGMEK